MRKPQAKPKRTKTIKITAPLNIILSAVIVVLLIEWININNCLTVLAYH
ncbi:hypothetical protein cce_2790 [Crocosphaera subtropica ATCC 51142]|uniref:Uncharacterized protein n=1 Tax=Crocosphaera subtropica (strain ATCC 51142 / BH68) TaxID=43989 RepID=B1WU76_CROS5|nr:hypothetical protein cce_2790 [Crocosphaera subtropica ATCC 51142]